MLPHFRGSPTVASRRILPARRSRRTGKVKNAPGMPFPPVWPHLFPLLGDHAGSRAVGEPRFCGSISVFPRYRAAPTSQRAPGREAKGPPPHDARQGKGEGEPNASPSAGKGGGAIPRSQATRRTSPNAGASAKGRPSQPCSASGGPERGRHARQGCKRGRHDAPGSAPPSPPLARLPLTPRRPCRRCGPSRRWPARRCRCRGSSCP